MKKLLTRKVIILLLLKFELWKNISHIKPSLYGDFIFIVSYLIRGWYENWYKKFNF